MTNNTGIKSLKENLLKIFVPLLAVFLLIFPMFASSYLVRTACTVLVYSMLAMSLNVLTGYCGIISMGHSAFLCIGAYASAILMRDTGCNWIFGVLFAMVISGLLGLALGIPTLKLSGVFLIMVTIGFNEIVRTVALVWENVTGGALGIKHVNAPSIFGYKLSLYNGGLYYLGLVLALITFLVCLAIKHSKWGRVMYAIQDDELATSMVGIYPSRYKILAFVISCTIAGFVGAYYSSLLGYIDPSTFNADMGNMILCSVLLGGVGNVPAMAVGAVIIIAIQEVFRFASEFRYVVFGLMLILLMKYAPHGLFGRPSIKPYRLPKGVVSRGAGQTEKA